MPESQKMWKNAPLVIGAVVLALITITGFVGDFPLALKSDVNRQFEELKERQQVLENLKNADNQWYREVAEDVAVVQSDVNHIKENLSEIKHLLHADRR